MGGDFGTATLRVVTSLILIVGLIVGLFYVLKQLRFRSLSLRNYPEMRLIGMLNLAPRKAVALVEICDQWLILGIGSENVTLISKLERPPEAAGEDALSPEDGRSFLSLIQRRSVGPSWRKTSEVKKNAKS